MGEWIRLTAQDGHGLDAYRALPEKESAAGGIVVVQEIFGVNSHIRALCEGYAREGYAAIAPAIFDRQKTQVELPYTPEATVEGRALRAAIGWDPPLLDIQAAAGALGVNGNVAVIGFCWGGSLAWRAACNLPVRCAVAYYGGQIIQFNHESPKVPVLLHFGEKDALIPAEDREAIQKAHPDVPVHVYAAGHGFNCTERADFNEVASALARERTLAFLREHLGS
ncbi:MAG: dienelactone hydrolase family protein [Byssovorax sp.]